jgi:phosphate transport system substrate-binding protein
MPVKVGKEKGAIGQISFSFLTGQTMVKPIVIDDQQPTVNNPNYPIKRPLYFTTKGAPRGVVKDFLEWTVSPDGQKVVKQTFVGIR